MGMYTFDFDSRLKKLNRNLWVDRGRISYSHPEYPICGLYNGNKYLMAVPQFYSPMNSVAGFDFEKHRHFHNFDAIKAVFDSGFCPKGFENEEELLWRGYKAILAELGRQGLININKAEKIFRCEIQAKRQEFPRNFVQHKVEM